MVGVSRIILPLAFVLEGLSHHCFLLDLNGAELLLISFILCAIKTCTMYNPIFFVSLAVQVRSMQACARTGEKDGRFF